MNLQLHAHALGFGRDLERLVRTANAIQYFARKAGCGDSQWFSTPVEAGTLSETARSARRGMFGRIWSDELYAPSVREQIRDATESYFEHQQRLTLRERWDGKRPDVAWLHDTLNLEAQVASATPEWECTAHVRAAIRADASAQLASAHSWRSAARLLQPRAELDRAPLERRIARISREGADASRVSRLIDGALARCRRFWPYLPPELAVVTQRTKAGCSALQVLGTTASAVLWWLEGVRVDGRLLWGDAFLTETDVDALRPLIDGHRWSARCKLAALPEGIALQLAPKAAATYAQPPAWWDSEAP
jgi:hypothetical protein